MGGNIPKTWFNYLQMLGDVIILNGAIALAFTIQNDWNYFHVNTGISLGALVILSLLGILLFNFYGLYHTLNKDWTDILSAVAVSIVLLSISIIIINYAIPAYIFPRRVMFSFVLVYAPVIVSWRWALLILEWRITPAKRVIIISTRKEAPELVSKLNGHHNLIGVVTEKFTHKEAGSSKVLGSFTNIKEIFASHKPQVVLMSGNVPEALKSLVARLSLNHTCTTYVVPNIYEIMVAQSTLDQLQDTPVFQIGMQTTKTGKEELKRLIDCVIASITLILTLPLTLGAAAAIKITSPGPIFYLQERVGRKGKHFMLYKFRTMVNNAEDKTGPVLCSKEDNRVTKVGAFLRIAHIDELPQLINVLKGDMSMVGPRPERPFFVDQFEKAIPGYAYRHVMNAGMTGLAQIAGRYSTSPEDKLRYDLLYAKGASPIFDLRILLQTVKVLFMKDKAS